MLRRRLAGDLDNIILKALRKEPARRYASAEQFSADIGQLHYSRATSFETSVAGKRVRLLAARAWNEKSRNLWDSMQQEGTLNAINAPDSKAVVAELEKCEAALNRLGR